MSEDKELLLNKAEGVKDCVKWIENKLKKEKEKLKREEKLQLEYGMFEDCGGSYDQEVTKRQARMEAMVEVKVELEKYMKKLRYEANEQ